MITTTTVNQLKERFKHNLDVYDLYMSGESPGFQFAEETADVPPEEIITSRLVIAGSNLAAAFEDFNTQIQKIGKNLLHRQKKLDTGSAASVAELNRLAKLPVHEVTEAEFTSAHNKADALIKQQKFLVHSLEELGRTIKWAIAEHSRRTGDTYAGRIN